jgi:hypothetical protein
MWYTLESDPALFTSLCSRLSNTPLTATEIYDIGDIPTFADAIGFIFLHKYASRKFPPSDNHHDILFVSQTCENNCATVAALNILLNASVTCADSEVERLKMQLLNCTPSERGLFIERDAPLRDIHNSYICPELEIIRSSINEKGASEVSEAFHYSAFTPYQGPEGLVELDGLVAHPIVYCQDKFWLDNLKGMISQRIQEIGLSGQEIRFALFAVCPGTSDDVALADNDNSNRSANYLPIILDTLNQVAKADAFVKYFRP